MNTLFLRSLIASAFTLVLTPIYAAEITVRVVDSKNTPVKSALVKLPHLDTQKRTNALGEVRFTGINESEVLIDIEAGHSGHQMQTVTLKEGNVNAVTITLDFTAERIVVTSGAIERRALDMATPAQVLAGEQLLRAKDITIADTIGKLPGVSAASFGAGVSRPVIRGQGGARVQMLSDGLGSMDASTISADHAVTMEPLVAEQVEVLRGPATLLYGSGAIGGVVNVIDQRIPDHAIDGIETGAEIRAQTVSNEKSGAVKLDAGNGTLALHVDAYQRKTANIDIPGFAERFPEAEEAEHEGEELPIGVLPNSDLRNDGFAVGGAWINNGFLLGLSYQELNSNYGVPGHHAHSEGDTVEGEEPVRIALAQRRIDIKARMDHPFPGAEYLKWRFGRNTYEHTELEGAEIGTVFSNKAYESRLELAHHAINGIKGVVGLHTGKRDFEAIGDEAFVPPSRTETHAIFVMEEKQLGNVRLEAGARVDRTKITPQSTQSAYHNDAASWSVGSVWIFAEQWNLALSYADAQRHPFAEELYSDGPHLATQSYEQGNTELRNEHAKNIDIGLRFHNDTHVFNLGVYQNTVNDYIVALNTLAEIDDLPVFQYQQADATLKGVELQWDWTFAKIAAGDYTSRVFYDAPQGKFDRGDYLPRMPSNRIGLGIDFENDAWIIGTQYIAVGDQTKIALNETATEGYSLLNAHVMYRFFTKDATWDAFIRADNLLDEEVRLHTSYLKDIAPQPGRSFTLGVRVHF